MTTFENKPHVLVVDDDDRLRALLSRFLAERGFMVTDAADAASARRKLKWFTFDLMVLDVMMPGEDGLSLLKSTARAMEVPVLMLSAMGEAKDRIKGLEIGAEDYLAKPFEPEELVLRLQTILRRQDNKPAKPKKLAFGEYVFDAGANQLTCGSRIIALTGSESALLKCLAESAGRPVTREALMQRMPGAAAARNVDVQVTRLRRKIGESKGKPLYLQTVRGAGYVLYGREGA